MSNIRYITATHIGMWAVDKYVRFCLLPQGDDPIMWDFGSAARHHKLFNPWLGEDRSRAGISTLRGSVAGRAEAVAEKIHAELEQRGLLGEPLGVDIVELPVLRALEAARDHGRRRPGADAGHAHGEDPRRDHAAEHGVLDGRRRVRGSVPGAEAGHPRERMRRARQQAAVRARLRAHRGDQRDLGRALQPAPARLHRPRCCGRATPRTSTSSTRSTATAPATTARSRSGARSRSLVDAYKRCRDILDNAISLIRPGVSTAEVVEVFPRAQEFGFADEEAAFALQYGHGVGLSSWEKPIFSRLVSFDYPETIEEGMVFALETFWPATDGWQAARIEEQLVVTSDGCEVITRFPAEELLVAGVRHYTVNGELPGIRETQSHLNNPSLADAVAESARGRGHAR